MRPLISEPEDDDRRLVHVFQATRSEAAFRQLYRRHAAALYGLLRHLTGGDPTEAEDLAQEAWLRAVAGLGRFRWGSSFRTWLRGIGVNCWRERIRGLHPEQTLSDDAAAPAELERHSLLDRLALEEALARLAPGYRAVLVLHDVEGYRHEEVADLLGITEGTSKSQLARARAALRRNLQ